MSNDMSYGGFKLVDNTQINPVVGNKRLPKPHPSTNCVPITHSNINFQGQFQEILFGGVDVLKVCRCVQGTPPKKLDLPTTSTLVPLGCCYGTVVLVV